MLITIILLVSASVLLQIILLILVFRLIRNMVIENENNKNNDIYIQFIVSLKRRLDVINQRMTSLNSEELVYIQNSPNINIILSEIQQLTNEIRNILNM